MQRSRLITRWITSLAAIALSLAWLHRLGTGDLGAPPLSFDGLRAWLDHRDTTLAAFALVRLVALGFGWYLLVITAIGGAARYLELARLTSVVDRFTLPFARGLLGGMALLGVMASPPPLRPQPAPNSMVELPSDPTSTTSTSTTSTTAPTAHATLHLLPNTPIAPAPAPAPVTPDVDANTWVVEHGESLWSIAAGHLGDVRGHAVGEREVATYWRQVVELNRSRMANPRDPDLLFTGQVVELPAVTPG